MEKIKVALRLRPFSYKEKMQNHHPGWVVDEHIDQIRALNTGFHDQPFNFDKIFTENHTNENIYMDMCQDVVKKTLEGIDTTIFVYGQTGAGKTHTMLGPPNTFDFNGIIFRSMNDIFDRVINREEGEEFSISCSYIEIYNEQVYDLLNKPEEMQTGLQIYEDADQRKFFVKGKTIVKVESLEEVFKILKYGETNRKYAETYFNHKSSRSHTIFQIHIRVSKITDQGQSFLKESDVNFVDLAGNERLQYEYKLRGKSQVKRMKNKSMSVVRNRRTSLNDDSDLYQNTDFYNQNERQVRMNESKHINKSLFFLTQVIYMTSKGKGMKFVPFRNSPLTKILRTSLGGNSRTVLILCISPSEKDFDITLSTLRFGKCAKKIENKIRANIMSSYDKAAIQAVVDNYEKKISMYNDKIKQLEDNQVDFVSFWKEFGNFKNKMIKKLMGLEKKKVDKNQNLGFSREEVTEDILNQMAGILFNVPLSDEMIMKKRFEGKNCMNCMIQRTTEQFQIKSIPKVFREFTKKLEKESEIEEFFKAAIEKFQINLKLFAESNEGLIQQNEHIKDLYEDFITLLFKEYNNVNEQLQFFTNKEKIKELPDKGVDEFYKKIKYIYKIYQEEKIRRKVIKEMNYGKKQLDDNEADTQQTEELNNFEVQYNELQNQIKEIEDQNLDIIKNFNQKYTQEFNKEVKLIEQNLAQYIDDIYEKNYKIQNKFFDIHKGIERRFKFYEKKIEWIYNNYQTSQKQNQFKKKKVFKEGVSQCMSDGKLSTVSVPEINEENKKDMKDFFMYNMLNKRMDKIHQFHQNLQEIKQMDKKFFDEEPKNISNNNINDKRVVNTQTEFYSHPQNTTQSQIMTQIPQPTEKPIPIKKTENQQIQTQIERRESRKLFTNPQNSQKETQEPLKTKKKFDLNNFLNKNHDLDFDIQKFKISTNPQKKSDKDIFEENLTPIASEYKNSFQTQKDNTLLELQDQLDHQDSQKQFQTEKKGAFSPMNYLTQSKKKGYAQLMKNYQKTGKAKIKDLVKK